MKKTKDYAHSGDHWGIGGVRKIQDNSSTFRGPFGVQGQAKYTTSHAAAAAFILERGSWGWVVPYLMATI